LRKKILEENPLYQFDNSYTAYAFDGSNVNDQNIIILDNIPEGYQLKHVFKTSGKYIGIYQNQFYLDNEINIMRNLLILTQLAKEETFMLLTLMSL
jgi:hypothetical protein